ncbi:MAG: FHA domain-containing protein [Phycisphaerales bacterium]
MATIVVLNGHNKGEWYTVGKRAFVFGRDSKLLAQINDPCVSRNHMEVRLESSDGCYYAVDMDSHNGVFVNSERVVKFKMLHEGDVIQIGHTLMAVTLDEFDDDLQAKRYLHNCEKKFQSELEHVRRAEDERREEVSGATIGLRALLPFGKRRKE